MEGGASAGRWSGGRGFGWPLGWRAGLRLATGTVVIYLDLESCLRPWLRTLPFTRFASRHKRRKIKLQLKYLHRSMSCAKKWKISALPVGSVLQRKALFWPLEWQC